MPAMTPRATRARHLLPNSLRAHRRTAGPGTGTIVCQRPPGRKPVGTLAGGRGATTRGRCQRPRVPVSAKWPIAAEPGGGQAGGARTAPRGRERGSMSNIEKNDNAAALYSKGDIEGFVDTYADNAVLRSPDGVYEGKAALLEYWT